jgi:hypothetical protein
VCCTCNLLELNGSSQIRFDCMRFIIDILGLVFKAALYFCCLKVDLKMIIITGKCVAKH